MDLQAILDATDSFSSSSSAASPNDNIEKLPNTISSSSYIQSSPTPHALKLELERILREHDDDDDDDDDDDVDEDMNALSKDDNDGYIRNMNNNGRQIVPNNNNNNKYHQHVHHHNIGAPNNNNNNNNIPESDNRSIGNTTISTKTGHFIGVGESGTSWRDMTLTTSTTVRSSHDIDAGCCDGGGIINDGDEVFYQGIDKLCGDGRNKTGYALESGLSDMPRLEISKLNRDDEDVVVLPSVIREERGGLESAKSELSGTEGQDEPQDEYNKPQDEYYGAHNPRDWAVLQAILSEVEEDDDDGFGSEVMGGQNILSMLNDGKGSLGDSIGKSHKVSSCTASGHPTVDTLLKSIGDSDSDSDKDVLVEFDEMVRNISKLTSPPTANHNINAPSHRPPRAPVPPPPAPLISSTTHTTTASRNALQHALNYEKRLLTPKHRDVISPLSIKRRLKPKIELSTKNRVANTSSSSHSRKNNTTLSGNAPKFGFAGIIQSQTLPKISAEMLKNAHIRRNAVGLPTALAVNSKFIAIGTQRGIILVFDLFEEARQQLGTSTNSDDVSGSVTSLDLSYNGEVIISGYTSGYIVLWDVIKGTVLKSVVDVHPSPITSVRFYNERDISVISVDAGGLVNKLSFSKNLLWSAYSVDTECLLDGTAGQILALSVLPPLPKDKKHLAHPSYDSTGTTTIAGLGPKKKTLVLIALSSEKSSFAVAVEPQVNVLHRWARPIDNPNTDTNNNNNNNNNNNSTTAEDRRAFLPCLAWNWSLIAGQSHPEPTLARAWITSLQFLRATIPPIDDGPPSGEIIYPAFGVHDEFTASAPVVSLEWLGERSLVYLTLTNEFTVVDTVMMTLLERLDFSGVRLIYAEFSLSRRATDGNKGSAGGGAGAGVNSTTFQNSMRASDNRLLILCQEELKAVTLLNTKQRIASLEDDGEWLEALALALDHYESSVKSLEDRRRDPEGKRDFSKHPAFRLAADSHKHNITITDSIPHHHPAPATLLSSRISPNDDESWIADLLLRYLKLAVENAPSREFKKRKHDLSKSHFQMLAGVCIEYCTVTRRHDLLFGPVFARFRGAGYVPVFFDVLEPYVLNDKLTYVAPEVMAQFVEYCRCNDDVATVERCLLHMDVTIMDFDSILTLLKNNHMYSALCFVFTSGLDDYVTPLEILLEAVFDGGDECDLYLARRLDGVPQNKFEEYGYKAILYTKHCLQGLTFPQGKIIQLDDRITTLRPQILQFLMQQKYTPKQVKRRLTNDDSHQHILAGVRNKNYPYLRMLMLVDAKAMLDVLSLALDNYNHDSSSSSNNQTQATTTIMDTHNEVEVNTNTTTSITTSNNHNHPNTNNNNDNDMMITTIKENQNYHHSPISDHQLLVDILSSILIPTEDDDDVQVWQYQVAKNAFYDFMAKYLLEGLIRAPPTLTLCVIERIASLSHSKSSSAKGSSKASSNVSLSIQKQNDIIALLKVLPEDSYDRQDVLSIVTKANMNRAALLLHKMALGQFRLHNNSNNNDSNDDSEDSSNSYEKHFLDGINCYLHDESVPFRMDVFSYIKKECREATAAALTSTSKSSNAPHLLRDAIARQLPSLIELHATQSAQLVAEIYAENIEPLLNALAATAEPPVEFQFLDAIISGSLSDLDSVAGPLLFSNLTMEHHERYLRLMAEYHPDKVYHHLSTTDNYRLEDCLALCQKYEIADASAYLLERMGNVSSALQLMLQTLEGKLMTLKRVVRSITVVGGDAKSSSDTFDNHQQPSYHRTKRRLRNQESDRKKDREIKAVKSTLTVTLDLCERNANGKGTKPKQRLYDDDNVIATTTAAATSAITSQLWFNVLDRLINAKGFLRLNKEMKEHALIVERVLTEMLQTTMQRMVNNVPLMDLVKKITTDHAGSRLGEFREMMGSLLETYGFEVEVCESAAEVMHADLRQMLEERRMLKLRGSLVTTISGIHPTILSPPSSLLSISHDGHVTFHHPSHRLSSSSHSGQSSSSHSSSSPSSSLSLCKSRLRKRRHRTTSDIIAGGAGANVARRNVRKYQSGGIMMTLKDQHFVKGEMSEDDVVGPRYIGVLGGAEHFGRFG